MTCRKNENTNNIVKENIFKLTCIWGLSNVEQETCVKTHLRKQCKNKHLNVTRTW